MTLDQKQATLAMMIHFYFVMVHMVIGSTIDNGVKGEPILECSADSMTINFTTEKEFEGHVYVKGHYDDSLCRMDATLKKNVNFTVPFSVCDVRRQRSMFITKIDKSYDVKCFYTETDRSVTARLDVSLSGEQQKKIIVMIGDEKHHVGALGNGTIDDFDTGAISNQVITQQIALPSCRYQVLIDGPRGPPVKYTSVGQQVYHQWSCADKDGRVPETNLYCTTVHSCVVKEESGKEVQLLDENGCTLDRFLLNNLVYTSDLTGGQVSQVFKFADQSSLYFHCQIRLSLKRGSCKRTSDECPVGGLTRGKRESPISQQSFSNDAIVVDVFSQSMTVFDIDDQINDRSLQKFEMKQPNRAVLCLTPISFGFLIAVFIMELLISTISVIIFCRKSHYDQNYCSDSFTNIVNNR